MDGFTLLFDDVSDGRGRFPLSATGATLGQRFQVRVHDDGRILLTPTHLVGPVCSVDGCGKLCSLYRQTCVKHYKRISIHGDPETTAIPTRGMQAYDAMMLMSEDGDVPERFWDGSGYSHMPEVGPCRVWTGRMHRGGYGQYRGRSAHRVMWEDEFGSCGDLVIDHLCLNKACIRIEHLEAVTHSENCIRRDRMTPAKTHCKQGHEFDYVNTYYNPKDGSRSCKTCRVESNRRFVERSKGS